MPRPRKTPVADGKAVVEQAVSNAGKALKAVIDALEANGAQITQAQFDKAFAFVHHTVSVLEAQARKDRLLKATESFSFDSFGDSLPATEPVQPRRALPAASVAPAAPSPPVTTPAPPKPAQPGLPGVTPADSAGKPIRAFTGRVSRHAAEENAGKPVNVELETPVIKPGEKLHYDGDSETVYTFMD